MKAPVVLALFSLCLSCWSAYAQTDDMDAGISRIAEKLGPEIKASGRKKVTVLDFSDLQGRTAELGRFLAEELSIALVERRDGFAVMDRANLKKILDELQLTADGLVDPENAKKLGQFSGVDAIVIGNVTPLSDEVALAVKIIATDTAEILGATKTRIAKGKEVSRLLGMETNASAGARITRADKPLASQTIFQKFGNLTVELEGIRALDNQTILVNLIFKNEGPDTIGIAAYCETSYSNQAQLRSNLLGTDGREFVSSNTDMTGIRGMRSNPNQLTEIVAGDQVMASLKYKTQNSFTAMPSSMRMQAELVVNPKYDVNAYPANFRVQQDQLPTGCKIMNLVWDIPTRK